MKAFSKVSFIFIASVLCLPCSADETGMQDSVITQTEFINIEKLSTRDSDFKAFQKNIEKANRDFFAKRKPELIFYTYRCGPKDDLISVSSRCCIPYDTIATLNSLEASDAELNGKLLYLPTLTGIFLSADGDSQLNILLRNEYTMIEGLSSQKVNLNGKEFDFYVNRRFSPSERAFFLSPGMVLPLEKHIVTSSFGMRKSPISGKWKMHSGIDLASPLGSSVFACKNGSVEKITKNDLTYGNCIVINHGKGLTSLYAHLGKISVSKGDRVLAGEKIGEVGLTGLTTGPHLHLEIKSGTKAENPENYLKL